MSNDLIIATARRLGATLLDPSETNTHQYRMHVRSESSSSLYVVSRRKSTQKWECSCMGWIRHRNCKHLRVMVGVLDNALAGASASPRVTPQIKGRKY
jgi:hypothetical protein